MNHTKKQKSNCKKSAPKDPISCENEYLQMSGQAVKSDGWEFFTDDEIPVIGEFVHESQKLACDYLINPVVIGGTHIGCDAIEDVYNAHHGLPPKQQTDATLER